MKVFRACSTFLVSVSILGCTSIPSHPDYMEAAQGDRSQSKRTIDICRPSSLYQMFRTPDLLVDDKKVSSIGNGERLLLLVPGFDSANLAIAILPQSGFGSPQIARISIPPGQENTSVLVGVRFADINLMPSVPPPVGPAFQVSSEWSIRVVGHEMFSRLCDSRDAKVIVHKSLFKSQE
jgi:hypothetical protein